MKNFLTFAWMGLAALMFIGGLASIGFMADSQDGLLQGLAIRGLYLFIIPLTLVTTGLIYRFIISRTTSSGVGVIGVIHLVIAFISGVLMIGAWIAQSLAMSGSSMDFNTMGILYGVAGAFSLIEAIFFFIAVLVALNSKPIATADAFN